MAQILLTLLIHLSAQRPHRETELLLLILNVADYIFELKITKRF